MCSHPDRYVEERTRQLNEDERQVTRTCIRCGAVVSTNIEVVRQW